VPGVCSSSLNWNVKFHQGKFALLAASFACAGPNANRAHPSVKSRGVRIGFDLYQFEPQSGCLRRSMFEQRAADAASHCTRQDPEMIEVKPVVLLR
jgi:hypothetical protein